jgi:protein-tyrosine phosphatase
LSDIYDTVLLETPVIDLHCHILPGLDDGPPSWERSYALAEVLAGEGITTAAATPHSYSQRVSVGADIPALVEEANTKYKEKGIPLTVIPGMEILLNERTMSGLKNGWLLTYPNTRTVLVETPAYGNWNEFTGHVEELIDDGYQVLLAHPEKILALQQDPNRLLPLVNKGMLTQITAAVLIGDSGPYLENLCRTLLLHGLSQVVASDAHGAARPRASSMRKAYQVAQSLAGNDAELYFTTIPRLILEEKPLPDVVPERIRGWRGYP